MAKVLPKYQSTPRKAATARKTSRVAKKLEHTEQAAFVTHVCFAYPEVFMFSVPNGAKRSAWEATTHRAEGMISGIPDLCIVEGRRGYFALFLEFKRQDLKPKTERGLGGVSKAQIEVHRKLAERGNCVKVVYGFQEAKEFLDWYMAQPKTVGVIGVDSGKS